MNSTIYLIIGRYGAGKNTLIDTFCNKYGYSKLCSYTTRQPFESDEANRHTYTDIEQYLTDVDNDDVLAYTKLMGDYYWSTFDQIENADFYIIDRAGLENFKRNYTGSKKYTTIYIQTDKITCLNRLVHKCEDISIDTMKNILSKNEINGTKYIDEQLISLCDFTIDNNGGIKESIAKLKEIVDKTNTEG